MANGGSETDGVHREYDLDDVEPVVAILESIAELEGGETTATAQGLDPPVNAYVDTDALTALVRSEATTSIALRISRYHVRIHGNTVEVRIAEE